MTEERVGSLQEEALKRKDRLAALKRKNDESRDNQTDNAANLPRPKFRSYKPQDDSLKENVLEDAKPGDVVAEVQDQLSAATSKVVVEELVSTALVEKAGQNGLFLEIFDGTQKEKLSQPEDTNPFCPAVSNDISNLAPRKPDWDLKRDVAKHLEKLERRTQKSIAELIMERLKQGQHDLAEAVNMAPGNSSYYPKDS